MTPTRSVVIAVVTVELCIYPIGQVTLAWQAVDLERQALA